MSSSGANTRTRTRQLCFDRQQVGHDCETQAVPGAFAIGRIIDAAQVDQLLETQGRVVAQRLHQAR
jgi:hypothetical protein